MACFHALDFPASEEDKLLAILQRQLYPCLGQSAVDGNQLIKRWGSRIFFDLRVRGLLPAGKVLQHFCLCDAVPVTQHLEEGSHMNWEKRRHSVAIRSLLLQHQRCPPLGSLSPLLLPRVYPTHRHEVQRK